jgi:hypothetical protein
MLHIGGSFGFFLNKGRYFKECSLLCMKIGAVRQSADNSVRKERELFAG